MSFLQSQGSPVAVNNNNISPIVVSLSYTKVSMSWNHDNSEKTYIELDVLLSKGTSNLREMLAGLEYLYFRDSNPHIRQAEELQD